LGITTETNEEPASSTVPAGHVTVSKRGTDDVELAETCIGPAPVNG